MAIRTARNLGPRGSESAVYRVNTYTSGTGQRCRNDAGSAGVLAGHKDAELAKLDAIAQRKVTPASGNARTYAVRKQGKGGHFYLIHKLPIK